MDNYLLLKNSSEVGQLSQKLGFTKACFLEEDLVLLTGKLTPETIKKINQAKSKKKTIVFIPETEEALRYILEKTPVDIVLGVENIHPKESLHYSRGGLDQILLRIAAERGKTIAFSFSEILQSKNRPRLLTRMRLNLQLCRKYKVKVIFSNFSRSLEELRSAKDLDAFKRILEKNN